MQTLEKKLRIVKRVGGGGRGRGPNKKFSNYSDNEEGLFMEKKNIMNLGNSFSKKMCPIHLIYERINFLL